MVSITCITFIGGLSQGILTVLDLYTCTVQCKVYLMTMEQHSTCIMKHICSVCNAVMWHMQCMSMHV